MQEWLEGKKTYIGLLIVLIGTLGQLFGPGIQPHTQDATDLLRWVEINWDTLMQFVGLVVAAYGRAVTRG